VQQPPAWIETGRTAGGSNVLLEQSAGEVQKRADGPSGGARASRLDLKDRFIASEKRGPGREVSPESRLVDASKGRSGAHLGTLLLEDLEAPDGRLERLR
jgi:hypothetical protein